MPCLDKVENEEMEEIKRNYPLSEILDSYNVYSKAGQNLIEEAYEFAIKAHAGQRRQSGEPYFSHPFEVAKILTDLKMDAVTIAAGLLHDTIEDCEEVTFDLLKEKFGLPVAVIVEGVTKLSKIAVPEKKVRDAESIRKMLLAMSKDIRVVIVKLADRLHNVRTLKGVGEEKEKRIAAQTLEIFAPLAHALGMYKIQREMEDLCFEILYPAEFKRIKALIDELYEKRKETLHQAVEKIERALKGNGINARTSFRVKHAYSVWRKMHLKRKDASEIYDLFGVRIIVKTVEECYAALGIVHTLFVPVQGRFKDYIAMPKSNGYQSLHTTLMLKGGIPFEVQIRTERMHYIAEEGIAAHWRYKEGGSDDVAEKIRWIRQLIEWHKDVKVENPLEYIEWIKVDLFQEEVFVFTPAGDVVSLPEGATALDFAYYIHTEVGNHAKVARVNGIAVPLDYRLKTGDIIEIITSKEVEPTREWLNWVATSRAKSKIRAYIRTKERELYLEDGLRKLFEVIRQFKMKLQTFPEETLKEKNIDLSIPEAESPEKLRQSPLLEKAAVELNKESIEELLLAVGRDEIKPKRVLEFIVPAWLELAALKVKREGQTLRKSMGSVVKISGKSGIAYKISKCCCPIPGDDVVGVVTRKGFISIHRKNCANVNGVLPERLVDVEWTDWKGKFEVYVLVEAVDREGLLMDVAAALRDMSINLKHVEAWTEGTRAFIKLRFEVKSRQELENVLKKIRGVKGVVNVSR